MCVACRTSWLSYYRLLGMPVLVALNSADTALNIEALSDQQAVEEAMQVNNRPGADRCCVSSTCRGRLCVTHGPDA